MIAVVTDSASQMPTALAAQLDVTVVPVTVTVDGVDYLEGVELDADTFYSRIDGEEALPSISTSQPTAAAFVLAFERALDAGATGILAILVGSAYSGAVNSAKVAARLLLGRRSDADIEIEIVDSGTASFGISCAVWAAVEAIGAAGPEALLADAKKAAIERAATTGSVFMIDGTELARRSGRFGDVEFGTAIPVLASDAAGLASLGEVVTVADGVDLMFDRLLACAPRVVVAVGRAAMATDPITDALVERLTSAPQVETLIEYRVGPSIAAHTGPNTVGGFSFPA